MFKTHEKKPHGWFEFHNHVLSIALFDATNGHCWGKLGAVAAPNLIWCSERKIHLHKWVY